MNFQVKHLSNWKKLNFQLYSKFFIILLTIVVLLNLNTSRHILCQNLQNVHTFNSTKNQTFSPIVQPQLGPTPTHQQLSQNQSFSNKGEQILVRRLLVGLNPTGPSATGARKTETQNDAIKNTNSSSVSNPVWATSLGTVEFSPRILKLSMYNMSTVLFIAKFIPESIANLMSLTDKLTIRISAFTWSPQFNIITFKPISSSSENSTSTDESDSNILEFQVTLKELSLSLGYIYANSLNVHTDYIGHASIVASAHYEPTKNPGSAVSSPRDSTVNFSALGSMEVIAQREVSFLEKIFKISAIAIVVVNFFNVGTQLDRNNLSKLLNSPRTTITAFVVTVVTMPLIAWLAGYFLVPDQLNYRFGAFLVGTCPAASSGSFYVLMLKGDKELAVTLQLLSAISATLTMPLWMMTLGYTITKDRFSDKIPYLSLVGTMLLLLQALAFGYSVGRCSQSLSKFVARVIRPFTFVVIVYLILFSTIAYWFIFKMFDLRLVLLGSTISLASYILAAFISFLAKPMDFAYTISVSVISSFKNTGTAFAVLLVAMQNPDCYIAFIPCLTQILAASSLFYLQYSISFCYDRFVSSKRSKDHKSISGDAESSPGADEKNPTSCVDEDVDVNVDDDANAVVDDKQNAKKAKNVSKNG